MRVSPDAEIDGLDLSQHGEVAATFESLPEPRELLDHVA
jgi:ammonia channel protein AmtB